MQLFCLNNFVTATKSELILFKHSWVSSGLVFYFLYPLDSNNEHYLGTKIPLFVVLSCPNFFFFFAFIIKSIFICYFGPHLLCNRYLAVGATSVSTLLMLWPVPSSIWSMVFHWVECALCTRLLYLDIYDYLGPPQKPHVWRIFFFSLLTGKCNRGVRAAGETALQLKV